MITLLAQATSDFTPAATPSVDWWAVMPVVVLAVPAMVLLHASSLLKRVFPGFYALYTSAAAIAAGAFAVRLWVESEDVCAGVAACTSDRGPFSTLGGAYGVDRFAVFITIVLCASVILGALLADGYLRREGLDGAELYALMLLSAAGGVIMASANDLIVMFLGLEVLSIAVYVLAAMHLRRVESQEAGLKYFVLGAFSSAFFLYGIALVYGATGSTSLQDIQSFLAAGPLESNALLLAGLALLLVGFGFKIAAVPFHVWTPDVYQGAPSPAVAYMASGVKAAAFAGLLRVFFTGLSSHAVDWQPIVYGLAVASLVGGTVLAVVQTDVKRMMAFSSISHAGYILLGVQAATSLGVSAALFYLAAYTFMIAGTFGIITVVGRRGDALHSLEDYRGLSSRRPVLALAFTVFLLAQAGVPLTSGFFAKFYVIAAAVDAGSYPLAVVAMLAAAVGAFIYLRVIVAMYMSEPEPGQENGEQAAELAEAASPAITVPPAAWVALGLALAVTLVVGFLPGLVQDLSDTAIPALVAAG
ncbi:MAG: NADH-quinone oxidoreductase subunit N [Acidimicrobiales bacterium]